MVRCWATETLQLGERGKLLSTLQDQAWSGSWIPEGWAAGCAVVGTVLPGCPQPHSCPPSCPWHAEGVDGVWPCASTFPALPFYLMSKAAAARGLLGGCSHSSKCFELPNKCAVLWIREKTCSEAGDLFPVNFGCLVSPWHCPPLGVVGSALWVTQGNSIASPPFPSGEKWHEQSLPRHVGIPNTSLAMPNLSYVKAQHFLFFHCCKGVICVSCERHIHQHFPVEHLPIPILLIWMCKPPAAPSTLEPVHRSYLLQLLFFMIGHPVNLLKNLLADFL